MVQTEQPLAKKIRTTAWAVAVLMALTGVVAQLLRQDTKPQRLPDPISLETLVPTEFGNWAQVPNAGARVVNPQSSELSDKIYSQLLARSYVSRSGYRVMLSIAYGADQRGALRAHKPEICYPAQGFALHGSAADQIGTADGSIPVRRLMTSLGPRKEPVTYWLRVGERAVRNAVDWRLAELESLLAGRVPDGVLFRVSSIDPNEPEAHRAHDEFIGQLLAAVTQHDRARLTGLTNN